MKYITFCCVCVLSLDLLGNKFVISYVTTYEQYHAQHNMRIKTNHSIKC